MLDSNKFDAFYKPFCVFWYSFDFYLYFYYFFAVFLLFFFDLYYSNLCQNPAKNNTIHC